MSIHSYICVKFCAIKHGKCYLLQQPMKIYFSFLCKLDISISHLCSAKKAMYLVYETTILQAAVTEKELNSLTTYPWDE